jgi:hypothetical protein
MNTEAPVTISGVLVFLFSQCMKRLRHLKALKKKTLRNLTASEEKKPGTLKSQAAYGLGQAAARATRCRKVGVVVGVKETPAPLL